MDAAELSLLIRDRLVWSQYDLARRFRMPLNAVHYIEKRKRKPSRRNAKKFVKLAEKLQINVTIEELLK